MFLFLISYRKSKSVLRRRCNQRGTRGVSPSWPTKYAIEQIYPLFGIQHLPYQKFFDNISSLPLPTSNSSSIKCFLSITQLFVWIYFDWSWKMEILVKNSDFLALFQKSSNGFLFWKNVKLVFSVSSYFCRENSDPRTWVLFKVCIFRTDLKK